MRRIAYGIVLLMFLVGTMFAFGCGEQETEDVDLTTGPDTGAEEDTDE